jgi:alginate O-acetyltransferase complex protein AlgJ
MGMQKQCLNLALLAVLCWYKPVWAQATALPGQNDWLFYRYEWAQANDAPDTKATLQLLSKMQGHFAKNGVSLMLVLVPSKIRIYADQLPAANKLDPYTDGKYNQALKFLRERQVAVADLNSAFLNSPLRVSDTPLFLRLDTHWAPSGALLAAQTVKAEIERQPALKQVYDAIPEVAYDLLWAKQKVNKRERDLIAQLPKGSPEYPPEQVLPYQVQPKNSAASTSLVSGDASSAVAITAIGSSYTDAASGYPDGLRYALQRELLDISIPVLQGPWVGMEAYVSDLAFQRSRPKLLLWEIPERELRSPPNYRFREARYVSDNQEWLLRTAAWVQQSCQEVSNTVTPTAVDAQTTRLSFAKPLQPLDYLQVTLPAAHTRLWQLQASNGAGETRQWRVSLPDDESPLDWKLALPHLAKGVTQLQINSKDVGKLQQWRVCRLGAELLE